MFIPNIDSIERGLSYNDGWWVWIKAVEEKFLPFEPRPLWVPDESEAEVTK